MIDIHDMFCWTYNVIDKQKYASLLQEKGVNPVIDISTDEGVDAATRLIVNRIETLKNGKGMTMSFEDDVTSFNILQLAASLSKRGRKWYVDKETALLASRLAGSNERTITRFVNEVLHGKVVVEPVNVDEITLYKDEKTSPKIKVRWEAFSDLLNERTHSVKGGWVYVSIPDVVDESIKTFKTILSSTLVQTGNRVKGSTIEDAMMEYANLLDAMVVPLTIPSGSSTGYIFERSPACIRMLDKQIASGIDIGHDPSLIVSFFLKTLIDLPDLVEYFYSRNPSNASSYSSPESFMAARKELDYVFKQMYGETGGGTSYESYGCNKIAGKGCCPFATFSSKESFDDTKTRVIELLESISEDTFHDLDDAARTAMYNLFTRLVRFKGGEKHACGLDFQLRFNREKTVHDIMNLVRGRKKKVVWHPVENYLKDAVQLENPQESSDQG